MKQTKEEIINKAISIMAELEWNHSEEGIKASFDSKEERIEEDKRYNLDKDLLDFAIENAEPDFWSVGFNFEERAAIQNNRIFVRIYDETGEPFEIRHKQARFKILKNDEGVYYTELI